MKTQIRFDNLKADILSGMIVALVSTPISMGYAQIAGLPPVYGLYGSLLPILCFGLLTSSPQFVVGVDAMPAVMVGNAVTAMGLSLGTPDAVALVPVISLLTGFWFLAFWLLRANRVVKYISTPVMGGFISGIGVTITMLQIPKLFGGTPGTGELPALLLHLANQLPDFHLLSALLGFGTVLIILISKRFAPKLPMPIFMMILGVIATRFLHIEELGVKLLPSVADGLPEFMFPDFKLLMENTGELVFLSLTIALVVMAQTLLASSNYAMKYAYKKVQDGIEETLTYCDFPSEHWSRIQTNNVIERLNREIRRRTRVVGCFPDGNSALMLVCARLRHVAGTQWGNKKYMNMKHLEASQDDASLAG